MHRTILVLCLAGVTSEAPALHAQAKPKPPAAAKPAPSAPAAADPIDVVLASGQLAAAYNPVLLNYLLEEGKSALPEAQRKKAVDQLVTRFKQELDISPGEEAVAATAALGGMLTGGAVGEGLRKGASGVYGDWVDAALLLTRAGYKEQAVPFLENCLRNSYSESFLHRCALGLGAADPPRALETLTRLEKDVGERRQVALWLLGVLAGQPKLFTKDKRDEIVDTLIARTQGMLNATYSLAAIRGLVAAQDPKAIEPLRKMTKGLSRAEEVERAAKRALYIGFKDETLAPTLEKDAKGGFGSDDDDKLFAASLLIEGGHDAGFAWAKERLTKKGGLLKIKKGNTEILDEIVWALVNKGGKKSIPVLQAALPVRKPTEWLSAYIAVGLLDLGDPAGIEVARLALGNEKWLSTRLEAAEGLAEHGDFSGLPVMAKLIEDKGFWKQVGDMSLGNYRTPEDLRIAVASSAADIDRPECVDILLTLLGEKSDEVRTAAAYALGRMKNPRTVEGLKRGLSVDYGKEGARLRSPQVRAHLLRMALLRFGKTPETKAMLDEAAGSEYLSVKFLALAGARR